MKTEIGETASPAELLKKLRRLNVQVPERTRGRKTEHVERWTVCRFLATFADSFAYPVSLIDRERPDFLLTTGRRTTGIEVTELIPENLAAYVALQVREYPDSIIDLGLFHPNSPELSVAQMRELLSNNKMTSLGWAGNEMERDWAEFFYARIKEKTKKFVEKDFDKFDENILLTYDNLPTVGVQYSEATQLLHSRIRDLLSSSQDSFDTVCIDARINHISISAEEVSTTELVNLWQERHKRNWKRSVGTVLGSVLYITGWLVLLGGAVLDLAILALLIGFALTLWCGEHKLARISVMIAVGIALWWIAYPIGFEPLF